MILLAIWAVIGSRRRADPRNESGFFGVQCGLMASLPVRRSIGLVSVLLVGSLWGVRLFAAQDTTQTPSSLTRHPACRAEDLSFRTDAQDGNFDGMSHSGTLLIIRNTGRKSCEIQAFPVLAFSDARGKLKIRAESNLPPHVHPGPVVTPVAIAPGEEATATLRWVSGAVFDDSVCLNPTRLSVEIGGQALRTEFQGRLCGERGKGVVYQMSRFAVAKR